MVLVGGEGGTCPINSSWDAQKGISFVFILFVKSSTELGRTIPEFVSLMWRMFLAEQCMVTENIRPVGVMLWT